MNPKLLVPKQKKMFDLNCIPTAFASKTGKKCKSRNGSKGKAFYPKKEKGQARNGSMARLGLPNREKSEH